MSAVWFRRFGDIRGVSYEMPTGVDLRQLRRRNAVPEIDRFEGSASLWWETGDGGTTESPASEHALLDLRAASVAQIRANLAEVLELPGEPGDYHFALQNAAGEL